MRRYEKEKKLPGYVVAGFYILAGCLICFALFLYGSSLAKNPLTTSGSVFPAFASTEDEEDALTAPEASEATDAPSEEPKEEPDGPKPPVSYSFVTLNIRSGLHVRVQPGMDAEIISRLSPGTTGIVLERGEDWSLVQTSEVTGYVSNRYLQFQEIPPKEEDASQ